MQDILGIKPDEIDKRDGGPPGPAPSLPYSFKDVFQGCISINLGPGISQHRQCMGIAAGHFRDLTGIFYPPVGCRLAPVEGLHGIKPDTGIVCITKARVGMRCNRETSFMPDG
jgi:hypothetical protein